MDKTKVVYSWIGPRGPIWNTELPNVYSFACVTFEGQTNSTKFNADDTWLSFFSHGKDMFEMYPSPAIEEDDDRPFIVPFSLVWRINFESYFLGRTGLLEFAHTPWHLIDLVRNKNGYIFIDYSVESFLEHKHINALHSYFGQIHNLPLHKIIYLTGTVNAKEIYDEYCLIKNIPEGKEHRLTIVPYASSQHIFKPNIERYPEPVYNTEIVPEKLFLSWNRRFRRHRIELGPILELHNVVDRSYVSFSRSHVETPSIDFLNEANGLNLNRRFNDIGITDQVIHRFYNKLPLVLDGEEEIVQMCQDNQNASRPYYQNSLISLITETNFHNVEGTLTEKSFKPFKEKHPFILVGAFGCLQALRDLGFRTFGEFWDESYDTIQDPTQRMKAISNIIGQISQWSDEQILEFKRNVKPIVEHNYQVLKNSSRRNIVEKIHHIVRGNDA